MRPMRSRCIFTSRTFPSAVFLFFLMNSEANVNIFCYVMSFSNEAGSPMQLTMNFSLVVYPFSRTLSRKLVVSFDAALPEQMLYKCWPSSDLSSCFVNGFLQHLMYSVLSLNRTLSFFTP